MQSLKTLIWAGRKWQNGNAVYREFGLTIRDSAAKNSLEVTSLRYLTSQVTYG